MSSILLVAQTHHHHPRTDRCLERFLELFLAFSFVTPCCQRNLFQSPITRMPKPILTSKLVGAYVIDVSSCFLLLFET